MMCKDIQIDGAKPRTTQLNIQMDGAKTRTTYFFLLAFSAALVVFPATSLGVVA